jgi:hypothetical protein
MNKLFINTIIQYGGKQSNSEKVVILNTISKYINKKMRILEYKYIIKLKLSVLPTDNWDSIPKSIGLQTFANIDGPFKGRIPIYTKTNINIPTPVITPIITPVPLTPLGPIGPVVGVPGFATNPFGKSDTIDERINRAEKYLDIIREIDTQLEQLKNGDITKSEVNKKYFDFIDVDEPDPIDDLLQNLNVGNVNQFYTSL